MTRIPPSPERSWSCRGGRKSWNDLQPEPELIHIFRLLPTDAPSGSWDVPRQVDGKTPETADVSTGSQRATFRSTHWRLGCAVAGQISTPRPQAPFRWFPKRYVLDDLMR